MSRSGRSLDVFPEEETSESPVRHRSHVSLGKRTIRPGYGRQVRLVRNRPHRSAVPMGVFFQRLCRTLARCQLLMILFDPFVAISGHIPSDSPTRQEQHRQQIVVPSCFRMAEKVVLPLLYLGYHPHHHDRCPRTIMYHCDFSSTLL